MRISDLSSDVCSSDLARRVLDRLLDAWPVRLALPAHEGRAVIFDGEREPRHKRVPAGIGKPRSNSSALMTPRPARWTSIGSIAPTAHAIVNSPSSTVPATPRPSAIAAESTRRSEEHTSELQSLMRSSYAVFCLKKKKRNNEA